MYIQQFLWSVTVIEEYKLWTESNMYLMIFMYWVVLKKQDSETQSVMYF